MKRNHLIAFLSAFFFLITVRVWAVPVYSVNGFTCKKVGVTVSCKGPIPGGKDSVNATGHNLVYITMDVQQNGSPTRYSYFSDTGCLVGYTFGSDGKAISAVAVHRSGQKGSFDIKDENYDQMTAFCEKELPNSPKAVSDTTAPKVSAPVAPAPAKPASPAKPAVKTDPSKSAITTKTAPKK